MAQTLQNKYALALLSAGFHEQRPTAKYRVFKGVPSTYTAPIWVYLGRSGAVRYNHDGKISHGSISLDSRSKAFSNLFNFTNVDLSEFGL